MSKRDSELFMVEEELKQELIDAFIEDNVYLDFVIIKLRELRCIA